MMVPENLTRPGVEPLTTARQVVRTTVSHVVSQTNGRRPSHLGRSSILLVSVMLVVSATIPAGAAALQSSPEPEDALEARERALDKLDRLEELDATTSVDVDWSVTRSIEDQIQQGNVSFRSGNYSAAIAHYEQAITQAKAALTRVYTEHSGLLLNASQAHLQKLEEAGYDRADVTTLQQQRQALEQRRQNIDSFADARDVHRDAAALHNDVDELPEPQFVRFVDGYYTMVVPLQIILMLLAAVLGAAGMRWYLDVPAEDPDDPDGPEGGETFRPTTMD